MPSPDDMRRGLHAARASCLFNERGVGYRMPEPGEARAQFPRIRRGGGAGAEPAPEPPDRLSGTTPGFRT